MMPLPPTACLSPDEQGMMPHWIRETDVLDFVADSEVKDFFIYTTPPALQHYADTILEHGISLDKIPINVPPFGVGTFFLDRAEKPQYGPGTLTFVVKVKKPLRGTLSEIMEWVQRDFEPEPPEREIQPGVKAKAWASPEEKFAAIRAELIRAGFDSVVITDDHGNVLKVGLLRTDTYRIVRPSTRSIIAPRRPAHLSHVFSWDPKTSTWVRPGYEYAWDPAQFQWVPTGTVSGTPVDLGGLSPVTLQKPPPGQVKRSKRFDPATAPTSVRPMKEEDLKDAAEYWDVELDETRHYETVQETKDRIARTIGSRISPTLTESIRKLLPHLDVRSDRYEDPRHALVDALQSAWAASSADLSITSLLLQKRAEAVFGLKNTWNPFDSTAKMLGLDDLKDVEIIAPTIDRTLKTVRRISQNKEFATAIDTAVREIYEHTQEWFRRRGITEVPLYRGVRIDETNAPLDWVEKANISSEMHPDEDHVVTLQPLSSFSTSRPVAEMFGANSDGGIELAAIVPVERIFCTAQTGPGCKEESEMIVLGGQVKMRVRFGHVPRTKRKPPLVQPPGKL